MTDVGSAAGIPRSVDPAVTTPFGPAVLGGAGYANLYAAVSEDEARAGLSRAWELGLRAYDTAPHYGAGLSEERLGRFLSRQPRDEFVLCTKVGRLLFDDASADPDAAGFAGARRRNRRLDYSADGVRRSLTESLERLGLDRVDLALIHDPEDHLPQALGEAAPALAELKAEGVIRGWGVGTNFAATAERFVAETELDHLMIAGRYTLLDRRADRLLTAAADRGVAVLTAGILNSNILVDPAPGARFNYVPASESLLATARRMADICQRYGVSLRAAALQFGLRDPRVSAVVLGAGLPDLIADSIDQLRVPIDEACWSELERLVPDPADLPD
ncbi:aldo/keto reductase [Microlunatus speluncae]|uniref:aldo/keto reductase n=1 Tax=Microlunatus speluncae TaxID=2594267 RepID=UPI001C2D2D79|nr:aldo/keto reductase [Microlunatus speluncae]